MSTIAALAIAALLAGHLVAQSPDKGTPDTLSRRAAQRIQELQREADALASRERTLLEELRRLEVERDLKTEELEQATRDVETITSQLQDAETRIATLEQTSSAQRPALEARLVEMYKLGNAGYLKLFLSIDDLRNLGRAYRFVSTLERFDRTRVAEHERTLKDLTSARATLEQQRATMVAKQTEASRSRAAAATAAASRDALIKRIDAQRDLNAQLIGELQTAERKLRDTLAPAGSGRGSAAAQIPLQPFRGDLPWPASGPVVTRFGRQQSARFRTSTVRNGIEIAAAGGSAAAAIHEGTVTYAAFFMGFGNLVIVDHGAQVYSLYGNLASIAVQQGTHVARGQAVGTVGKGLNGSTSLYFEMRIDGKPVDPLQWLRKR